jgi:hypothetical protein
MAQFWGDRLTKCDNMLVVYSLDAFEPDILAHGGPSAYPPHRIALVPSFPIRASLATLVEARIEDGEDLANAASFVNYALFGTSLTGDF